jgi:hypothetical protein
MRIFVLRALLAVAPLLFAIAPAGSAPVQAQSATVQAGKGLSSQTNRVSRIAVAPMTSKSGAIGRLREPRTTMSGLLRRIRITKP